MDDFTQNGPKRRQVFRPVGEGKKVSVTPLSETRPTRLSVEPRAETASAPAAYERPAVRPMPANKLPKAPQAPVTAENLRHLQQLRDLSNEDLFALAEDLGVKDPTNLRRFELMFRIVEKVQKEEGAPQEKGTHSQKVIIRGEGVLDIVPDGFGFLRAKENSYTGTPEDVYVSPSLIRRLGLRNGDSIVGTVRYPNPGERYFALVTVEELNGLKPEQLRHRPNFDKLTPLYPTEKFNLESVDPNGKDRTGQVIDLVAPIGKGQRCMLVAPPKAGKTMMMKAIAHAIEDKHPDCTLMVLLVDERPEEVTDMERAIRGEVISSTFDEPASRHVQVSEMVIEKAKRLVEMGQDVVILLDSLTRLARAYNTVVPSSGKVLTGGVDANALQKPKRFFGAARKIEEGGSLTIIATALIDTGSRMDEVIFEEFKGTGNSEIWLDRKLVEKRTYPAIDIAKSGTRHEEILYGEETLQKIWILRRILQPMGVTEAMEFLLDKLRKTKTNAEFFRFMSQG
jgi:transcription termination factor Rho